MSVNEYEMAEEITNITVILQKVVPVVILIVGSIGNCLSFVVLTRPETRQYSTAVFLIVLTVVDFIAMYSGLLRILIQGYFETDIRLTSVAMCKIHTFIIYFSTHTSSWIIVAVTLKRVISVWGPIKAKMCCSSKVAVIAICFILFILASANAHLLYGMSLVTHDNLTLCQPSTDGYKFFVDKAWPWIDMALLFLIPLGFILIGNIMIIIKIRISRTLRRESCPYFNRRTQNPDSLYFLTGLLITLNVVFVVCVSPIVITIIGQYFWWPYGDFSLFSEKEYALNNLQWVIVNFLVYINYAVNFILYLTCGTKFRQDLRNMCCYRKQSRRTKRSSSRTRSSFDVFYIPSIDILNS